MLSTMDDIFTYKPDIKSYLISGIAVRILRTRLKIGFRKFCFKAGLSSSTLARIEKSESIIIKAETMRSLMVGFNLTRNGMRSRPVLQSAFSKGSYTKSNPQLLGSPAPARKMTVYVPEDVRRIVLPYARSNNVSENQALLCIARSYLGLTSEKMKYHRNMNSFDIFWRGSL